MSRWLVGLLLLLTATSAHAAITWVGGTSNAVADGSGTFVDMTLITGLAQNDVCILGITQADYVTGTGGTTSSADWVSLQDTATGTVNPSIRLVIYRKVMGATPDTTATCLGNAISVDSVSCAVQCFRGVDTTTPEDQTVPTMATATSTNPDSPAIVTQTAGAWVLSIAASRINDSAITLPSGYTNKTNTAIAETHATSLGMGSIAVASPATEDPPSWTGWSSALWLAATVALKPYVAPAGTAVRGLLLGVGP